MRLSSRLRTTAGLRGFNCEKAAAAQAGAGFLTSFADHEGNDVRPETAVQNAKTISSDTRLK